MSLIKIVFFLYFITNISIAAAAGNSELKNFLAKQEFPSKPSEDFFFSKSLKKNSLKYGAENDACGKSNSFYYAETYSKGSDPWFGVVYKTIVAKYISNPADRLDLGDEYDKIRKKFGKPFEDAYSPLIGFRGDAKMLYKIDYEGIPVTVHFHVIANGCLLVKMNYFLYNSKPKDNGITDALK